MKNPAGIVWWTCQGYLPPLLWSLWASLAMICVSAIPQAGREASPYLHCGHRGPPLSGFILQDQTLVISSGDWMQTPVYLGPILSCLLVHVIANGTSIPSQKCSGCDNK